MNGVSSELEVDAKTHKFQRGGCGYWQAILRQIMAVKLSD